MRAETPKRCPLHPYSTHYPLPTTHYPLPTTQYPLSTLMTQSIILGIGAGRCGLRSLTTLLNQQPEVQASYRELPFLTWRVGDGEPIIKARFARFRNTGRGRILGDVAPFYLPYLEIAIAAEPAIRIVCLRRSREEVVASYCEWLDQIMPLPTDHWAKQPAAGWHHDLVRTPTFPQYDTQSREEGIRRYWDDLSAEGQTRPGQPRPARHVEGCFRQRRRVDGDSLCRGRIPARPSRGLPDHPARVAAFHVQRTLSHADGAVLLFDASSDG